MKRNQQPSMLSRRRFLQTALAAGSAAAVDPKLFFGSDAAFAGPPLGSGEHILVMIELDGGNDGLNTLVPYTDAAYYSNRGAISIPANQVLPLGEGLGLNPRLPYLKARWDAGNLAVVRGVGHPDKDHSHFSGMAKVMAGSEGDTVPFTGWLGRYLDGLGLDGLAGVSVADGGIPLLLQGERAECTGLPAWSGGLFGSDRRQAYERITYDTISALGGLDSGKGLWGNEVGQTFRSAVATAQQINPIYSPSINGDHPLLRSLTLVARLINLDVGARVLHVRLGGFDNHDDQMGEHAELMDELNLGIEAFFNTLFPQFHGRVTIATFSEFGRRVKPNDSAGTDHGEGSMLFVLGNRVKGGFYGQQPSCAALDSRGDLVSNVDIRSVFATLLSNWLGADDHEIFGRNFAKFDMFKSANSCAPALTDNIPPASAYYAMAPVRILDTRVGNGAPPVPIGADGVIELAVAGAGTLPAAGVGAVVLNVTAVDPTAASYVTVWPSGTERPVSSNLNFGPGQTVPNLVLTKIGANGKVSFYNESGQAHLIADVMGWFPTTNSYKPLYPSRLLDTRLGIGAPAAMLAADSTLKLGVLNNGGVPASGVDSVVLNVTAAAATEQSYLTVWPTGEPQPNASNLNMVRGSTVPNLVIAKVGGDGTVSIYNAAGSTHVIADVMGWFPAASGYHSLTPMRILDTRIGIGAAGAVPHNRFLEADGRCQGNVPSNAKAVVLNVTVTGTTGGGYLTVWPAGEPQPEASNLNFVPGQTVPNLVITKVGESGMVSFFNYGGDSHVIADVMGWFE